MPNMAATGPQAPQAPKPQQPTMPAGQMLSGVAGGGLGSILDNVARPYAGNPQALEQKGMSGDLLAALAAQRLKSQKEHALAQLKLQAGGQQQGQPQKTVVEQNEDALMEMTKQEMTAEQADTLKQKQGQMQNAQKQLMQQAMAQQQPQGIAGIPAPNAAEPKAMAAGGIIAFAGDTDGSYVGSDMGTDPDYTPSSGQGLMGSLPRLYSQTPEEQARIQELLRKYQGKIDYKQARAIAEGRASEDQLNRPVGPAAPAAETTQKPPVDNAMRRGLGSQQPTPRPAAPSAPAQLSPLQAAQLKALQTDPQAMAAAEREATYKFMAPEEADIADRRAGLASLRELNKAYQDPDKAWVRRMLTTLPSGPSAFGATAMGQMGAGAARAAENEYLRSKGAISDEQAMLKGIMSDIAAPKKDAVTAGTAGLTAGTSLFTHGLSAATQQYIGELQAAAQRDIAAASREGASVQRLTGALSSALARREQARNKLLEQVPMLIPDYLLLSKGQDKLSSSEKQRAIEAQKQFDALEQKTLGQFDTLISNVEAQLGYNKGSSGTTGSTGKTVSFGDLPK